MNYVTLFTVLVSTLLIEAIALTLTWRQNRHEIGIRDWAVGCGLMAASILLSAYGLGVEPANPATSIAVRILASAAGMLGWLLVWIGARHFYARKTLKYSSLLPIMLAAAAALAIRHDPSWRIMLSSGSVALLALLTLREFVERPLLRHPTNLFVIMTLFFTCVVWALRAIAHVDAETSILLIDAFALYAAIVGSLVLTLSLVVLTNERVNQQLRSLANRDPLTGIMNRRAFYEASASLLANLKRDTSMLAVCMLDIDHFKIINDLHGHAVGDQVLKQFTQIARSTLREGDLFARYGGEEFVVLLHNSDKRQAEQAIERLRLTCASQGIELAKGRLDMTFSAGISLASGPVAVSMEALLKVADTALHRAKEAGRNRTVVFHEAFDAEPAIGRIERLA